MKNFLGRDTIFASLASKRTALSLHVRGSITCPGSHVPIFQKSFENKGFFFLFSFVFFFGGVVFFLKDVVACFGRKKGCVLETSFFLHRWMWFSLLAVREVSVLSLWTERDETSLT